MDGQSERRTHRKRAGHGGPGLLAVQSIIGVILLLLALVMRLAGGSVFDQLKTLFEAAITDDSLAETMVDRWQRDEEQDEEQDGKETEATKPDGAGGADLPLGTASILLPAEGATFSPLEVSTEPHPLMNTGTVTSQFGYRTDPIRGGTGFHTGIDIAAEQGTPLYALYGGTVIRAGWDASYGRYVVLQCGDLELWYAHCSVLCVSDGQSVTAGQQVAAVGNTGDSTGPHVHLMARRDGLLYDPSPLVRVGGDA